MITINKIISQNTCKCSTPHQLQIKSFFLTFFLLYFCNYLNFIDTQNQSSSSVHRDSRNVVPRPGFLQTPLVLQMQMMYRWRELSQRVECGQLGDIRKSEIQNQNSRNREASQRRSYARSEQWAIYVKSAYVTCYWS